MHPDYINVDISNHEGVNVVWDLNFLPWPWPDGSVDQIIALDVLEHLDSFLNFFNECWRVMVPGGEITVRVPHYSSRNVPTDPTHKRGYDERSFDYLDFRTELGSKYGKFYTDKFWHIVSSMRTYIEGNVTVVLRADKTMHQPWFIK